MRMFAGPNGSGKSTLKAIVGSRLLGVYINPDELEHEIVRQGFLDLEAYAVHATEKEILPFFCTSSLLEKADLLETAKFLK